MSASPTICEAIAAVMKAPRTRQDMEEMLGITSNMAWRVIAVLHRSGLIYVTERRARPVGDGGRISRGPRIPVYAFQPAPYEKPDVPVQRRSRRQHARGQS